MPVSFVHELIELLFLAGIAHIHDATELFAAGDF